MLKVGEEDLRGRGIYFFSELPKCFLLNSEMLQNRADEEQSQRTKAFMVSFIRSFKESNMATSLYWIDSIGNQPEKTGLLF